MVAVAKALTRDERAEGRGLLCRASVPLAAPAPPRPRRSQRSTERAIRRAGSRRALPVMAPTGEGNAGNPPLAGQPAPYLERQLADWREGNRYGDPLGVMTRIAKALTPAESAALSAYAARLPGGPGYSGSPGGCPPARRASSQKWCLSAAPTCSGTSSASPTTPTPCASSARSSTQRCHAGRQIVERHRRNGHEPRERQRRGGLERRPHRPAADRQQREQAHRTGYA